MAPDNWTTFPPRYNLFESLHPFHFGVEITFGFQIEALPEILQAVKGTGVEVYMDGGVTQGTDAFKALALGAKMVIYYYLQKKYSFVIFRVFLINCAVYLKAFKYECRLG